MTTDWSHRAFWYTHRRGEMPELAPPESWRARFVLDVLDATKTMVVHDSPGMRWVACTSSTNLSGDRAL